jgi:hypothetical protein
MNRREKERPRIVAPISGGFSSSSQVSVPLHTSWGPPHLFLPVISEGLQFSILAVELKELGRGKVKEGS